MLRGCQKKIIMLKNTGSGIFDEAYFILKESAASSSVSESDMLCEANRIIAENQLGAYCARKVKLAGRIKYCLAGAGCCGALVGAIMLLVNLF